MATKISQAAVVSTSLVGKIARSDRCWHGLAPAWHGQKNVNDHLDHRGGGEWLGVSSCNSWNTPSTKPTPTTPKRSRTLVQLGADAPSHMLGTHAMESIPSHCIVRRPCLPHCHDNLPGSQWILNSPEAKAKATWEFNQEADSDGRGIGCTRWIFSVDLPKIGCP